MHAVILACILNFVLLQELLAQGMVDMADTLDNIASTTTLENMYVIVDLLVNTGGNTLEVLPDMY